MSTDNDVTETQRLVVLHLLCDEHPEPWSRAELHEAIEGGEPDGSETAESGAMEPADLDEALKSLAAAGVVAITGDTNVEASPCARQLDALDLVAM